MIKHCKTLIFLFLHIALHNPLIYSSNHYNKPRPKRGQRFYNNYRQHRFIVTAPNDLQNAYPQAIPETALQYSYIIAQSYQPRINSQIISQRIQQANDQKIHDIIAIATQKAQSIALSNQPFSKERILDHCKAQRHIINELVINDYLNRNYNIPDNLDDVLQKAYISTKPQRTH